jgi:hypothetical protein
VRTRLRHTWSRPKPGHDQDRENSGYHKSSHVFHSGVFAVGSIRLSICHDTQPLTRGSFDPLVLKRHTHYLYSFGQAIELADFKNALDSWITLEFCARH